MTFTSLRNGPTMPDDALELALTLEVRGHMLSQEQGRLLVTNGSRLTEADRAAIQHWKAHLLAIVEYARETS